MRRTVRLIPMIAAVCLAAISCTQQPAQTPGNEVAVTEADSANIATEAPSNMVDTEVAAVVGDVPTGGVCDGMAGAKCASRGDFCKHEIGQCNVADAQGVCTKRPQVCTEEYRPVCGCDGKTYGNACNASAAGVNVQSPGKCPGT